MAKPDATAAGAGAAAAGAQNPATPGKGKGRAWDAPTIRKRSADADGVVTIQADVSEGGSLYGTVTVTITPGRALSILWTTAPGQDPITGFQAWSTDNVNGA